MASYYGFLEAVETINGPSTMPPPATTGERRGVPAPHRHGCRMSLDRKAYMRLIRDVLRSTNLTSLRDPRLHGMVTDIMEWNKLEKSRETYDQVRLDIRNALYNTKQHRKPRVPVLHNLQPVRREESTPPSPTTSSHAAPSPVPTPVPLPAPLPVPTPSLPTYLGKRTSLLSSGSASRPARRSHGKRAVRLPARFR